MKQTLKFFILVALGVLLFSLIPYKVAYEAGPAPKQKTYKDWIVEYTTLYGSNKDEVYSVGWCESGFSLNPRPGDSGSSFGQFAYFEETWARYSRKFNEKFGTNEVFDIGSIHDQVKLTAFAFSLGDAAKSEWTTWVAIKNGGTYAFYSKHNKRDYVIHCSMRKLEIENT